MYTKFSFLQQIWSDCATEILSSGKWDFNVPIFFWRLMLSLYLLLKYFSLFWRIYHGNKLHRDFTFVGSTICDIVFHELLVSTSKNLSNSMKTRVHSHEQFSSFKQAYMGLKLIPNFLRCRLPQPWKGHHFFLLSSQTKTLKKVHE